ncbi:unnamed protein product, partial [marine sediment metagenome]
VTGVTGNPLLGLGAGVVVAYPAQAQDLWQELVDNGATEEEASKLAVPLGVVIASVEVLGDLPLLAAISKPFKRLLSREITKQVGKKVGAGIAKRGAKTFFAIEGAEILEELIQGGIQDATVKTFNENVDLLEKIPETVVQTAMATAPLALIGVGGATRMNINERLSQKIIENNKRIALEKELKEKVKLPEVKEEEEVIGKAKVIPEEVKEEIPKEEPKAPGVPEEKEVAE